jgi:hypothetical protein
MIEADIRHNRGIVEVAQREETAIASAYIPAEMNALAAGSALT